MKLRERVRAIQRKSLGIVLMSLVLMNSACGSDKGSASVQQGAAAVSAVQSAPLKETSAPAMVLTQVEEAKLAEGQQAMEQQDYAQALRTVESLLKNKPQAPKVLAMKGMILALQGKTDEGLRVEQEAYRLAPTDGSIAYNMAMIYKLEGRLQEALPWFEKVLVKDPHNAWTLYGIATIYADLKQPERALFYLQKAIAADSKVKEAARVQEHFASFHGQPAFEALVR